MWEGGLNLASFKVLHSFRYRRFYMHILIHIHKHRYITGESAYPPGLPGTEALDPYTYVNLASVSGWKRVE